MAAASVWIARRRMKPGETDILVLCRDTAVLAACTILILSPHYPWYFPWLALPAIVAPIPAVIWLSVAPVILYLDPGNEHIFWGAFVYIPAIALAVFQLSQSRLPKASRAPLHQRIFQCPLLKP